MGRLAIWAACALSHGRQPGNPARPALKQGRQGAHK
jgi:hypothetical protein